MVAEAFEEAKRQQGDALDRLRSERDRLIKQKIQRDEQAGRLTAMPVNPGDSATLRRNIGEAEERSATITRRLGELDQEITSAQCDEISFEQLTSTLAEFDAVWNVLVPSERGQLINSLVERVICSPDGEIRVIFRADK